MAGGWRHWPSMPTNCSILPAAATASCSPSAPVIIRSGTSRMPGCATSPAPPASGSRWASPTTWRSPRPAGRPTRWRCMSSSPPPYVRKGIQTKLTRLNNLAWRIPAEDLAGAGAAGAAVDAAAGDAAGGCVDVGRCQPACRHRADQVEVTRKSGRVESPPATLWWMRCAQPTLRRSARSGFVGWVAERIPPRVRSARSPFVGGLRAAHPTTAFTSPARNSSTDLEPAPPPALSHSQRQRLCGQVEQLDTSSLARLSPQLLVVRDPDFRQALVGGSSPAALERNSPLHGWRRCRPAAARRPTLSQWRGPGPPDVEPRRHVHAFLRPGLARRALRVAASARHPLAGDLRRHPGAYCGTQARSSVALPRSCARSPCTARLALAGGADHDARRVGLRVVPGLSTRRRPPRGKLVLIGLVLAVVDHPQRIHPPASARTRAPARRRRAKASLRSRQKLIAASMSVMWMPAWRGTTGMIARGSQASCRPCSNRASEGIAPIRPVVKTSASFRLSCARSMRIAPSKTFDRARAN